ncbi:hypothetical protein A7X67_03310 [Clostridium sp. W14A]|nr:hypothetical protein A7X67_03310 [Clostridium sp. W14A]
MADNTEDIALSYQMNTDSLLAEAAQAGKEAAEQLNTSLTAALSGLGDRIAGSLQNEIGTAFRQVLPVFSSATQTINGSLNQIIVSLQSLGAAVSQNLGAAQGQKAQGFSSALQSAFASVPGVVQNVVDQLGNFNTVHQAFETLKSLKINFEPLKKAFIGISSVVSGSALPILAFAAAVTAIALIATLIIKNWEPISAFFKNLWNDLVTGMTNLWNTITGIVKKVVQPLIQAIMTPFDGLQASFSRIFAGIQKIFTGAFTVLKNVLMAPILVICDLITGNFGKIGPDLQKIWANITKGIRQVWTGIQQYFTGLLTAIATIFKNTWNGFISVVTTIGAKIKTSITTLWNSIISWFSSLPETLKNIGANMFNSMRNGVESTVHTVADSVKSGIGAAIDWIKNLPKEAIQWGRDIIGGIADGIRNAAKAVGDAVNGVAKDIRKFLHFSVPDEGPLVDFPDWMPDMMKGLASGIRENKSLVTAALQDLTGTMTLSLSAVPAGAYSGSQQPGAVSASGRTGPTIDYHPVFQSPKALSYGEVARQERMNAQRLSLCLRRR